MRLSDYDYILPDERIAQTPIEPRDAARLLCLDRQTGEISHHIFRDIAQMLSPDDLLVINETRVSAVRLWGTRAGGGEVETLLLRPVIEQGENVYDALVRPGRKVRVGDTLTFERAGLSAEVLGVTEAGGRYLRFYGQEDIASVLMAQGRVPLPPYITKNLADPTRYQTVYAKTPGSAAAPTAGLHFTPELLARITEIGVGIARVRLDVGLGTFRPIKTDDVSNHTMHAEFYEVSEETARQVNACKGRVIAVGTTSVRALESAAKKLLEEGINNTQSTIQYESPRIIAARGETDIFLTPGVTFRAVDALITNFHQPHSTLLLLVAAFAGREPMRCAYETALSENYRFLSFGDAMFIY
jgi:S-adenosylmethionine:tRNA ribosyltransferase-isomerase